MTLQKQAGVSARVEYGPAGAKLWIGGIAVKTWLGTLHDEEARDLAARLNALLATAPPEQVADRGVTVALEQVTNALEECAVLLCEVHMRFGEPKIMDDDFQKEGEFTFKQAGQMYEEQAKRARGILAKATSVGQPQPASDGALSVQPGMTVAGWGLPDGLPWELANSLSQPLRPDGFLEARLVNTRRENEDDEETVAYFLGPNRDANAKAIVELVNALASHDQKVRREVCEAAVLLVDKAFEQSWVVQDTLDAIRALAAPAASKPAQRAERKEPAK